MTDTPSEVDRSLAAKVDHLFRTIRPRDGGEFSFEVVADAIRADGVTISATYVWQLRRGVRDNPTKRHLEALANFFGVPPTYFFDDDVAERIDAELALLSALRDSSVRQLALRASGLSPKSLNAISEMVNRVREIEGLPEPTDD